MTKTKNTLIPQGEALLTTPLSVADCIKQLQEMKHFDLTVNILRQSKHSAELKFIERHNDDLPLYVTSRLMTTNDGTRVSFELSEYLRERTAQKPESGQLTPKQSRFAGGFVVAIMMLVFGGITVPEMMWSTILCTIPFTVFIFGIGWLAIGPVEETPAQMGQRSHKIKALMHQRAEVLKADIIDALTIDPTKENIDELGNVYYIDMPDVKYKRDHD